MLDDKDIQKMIEVFVTREEFQGAISNLSTKEDIKDLHAAIDAYAKKVDVSAQEMIMLAHKVDRHEQWLHQIADKLGIKLKY